MRSLIIKGLLLVYGIYLFKDRRVPNSRIP